MSSATIASPRHPRPSTRVLLRDLRPLWVPSEKDKQICLAKSSIYIHIYFKWPSPVMLEMLTDIYATRHPSQHLPASLTPPCLESGALATWVQCPAQPSGVSVEAPWAFPLHRRESSLIRYLLGTPRCMNRMRSHSECGCILQIFLPGRTLIGGWITLEITPRSRRQGWGRDSGARVQVLSLLLANCGVPIYIWKMGVVNSTSHLLGGFNEILNKSASSLAFHLFCDLKGSKPFLLLSGAKVQP